MIEVRDIIVVVVVVVVANPAIDVMKNDENSQGAEFIDGIPQQRCTWDPCVFEVFQIRYVE